MKKIFTLIFFCLLTIAMSAQRAAVMEFKAGVGVSQNDVDGLCGMFTTGFRPSGYTIIERSQIDRIISEQNMQRSRLTESQMIRIGELLNLSCIVIGDVNVVMGEYNVDVRVINVESGVVIATAGKAFTGSYGENMRSLAQTLASKIAINPAQVAQPKNSNFVDLGLPSGTEWKRENEVANYLTYNQAMNYFGDNVPTREQYQELIDLCRWEWTGKGYKVIGLNGNFIYFPALGGRNYDGTIWGVESADGTIQGGYLTSSFIEEGVIYYLHFFNGKMKMRGIGTDMPLSVRLVK